MPVVEVEPALRMMGRAATIPGYINGLRQPCLRFEIGAAAEIPSDRLRAADAWMRERFPGAAAEPADGIAGDARIAYFLAWVRMMLLHRDHPVLEPARVRQSSGGARASWIVQQPCLDFGACLAAAELALASMNLAAELPLERLREALDAALAERSDALDRGRPGGFNTLHFIEAAHALGLPWRRLAGNVLQIGQGAASRLLDSSLTDRTPAIGTAIARNKVLAANLLREAGLPAPPHALASSADDAAAVAVRLGYPVVVKPADQDGGVGVAAFLHDADAVRAAYDKASQHSQRVLVEKYVHGNDYRLHVVGEEVQGVLERSPGGVTGDGRHSVRVLVERQNHERETATDDRRHLHAIVPDEEAATLLAGAGLSWDSVPPEGSFVRLRGASNVAGGGIPLPMPPEDAHPDNLALAVRAVRVLRLDVAGVDLLMPDIRRSWHETGAGICEVNAKPQMFTTFHLPMLRSMMGGGDGRVPVAVVLSPGDGEAVSVLLHERLCAAEPSTGLVAPGRALIGDVRAVDGGAGSFEAARALLIDPRLRGLVLAVGDRQIFSRGWPVDRCDVVVLAGGGGAAVDQAAQARFRQLCGMAKALRPRVLLADAGDGLCAAAAREPGWRATRAVAGGGEALAGAAAEWLGKGR